MNKHKQTNTNTEAAWASLQTAAGERQKYLQSQLEQQQNKDELRQQYARVSKEFAAFVKQTVDQV